MANEVRIRVTATDEATRTINGIRAGVGGLATAGIAMGAAMAGAAATAGFAVLKLATSYSTAGAAVYDLSKRTGFTTEALSELKHAADLSGTSIEGLEVGIRRMQNVVVDASNGLKTAKDSLGALGLSVADLKGLKPEAIFDVLLQRLATVEDDTLKTALATDLFGRSGTQLLPILADGSEGLAKMRAEAHDLGIVFDTEAAAKADQFDDSMLKLRRGIDGVKYAIGAQFLPVLQPMIDSLSELIRLNGEKWARDFAAGLAEAQRVLSGTRDLINDMVTKSPFRIIVEFDQRVIGATGSAIGGINSAIGDILSKGGAGLRAAGGVASGALDFLNPGNQRDFLDDIRRVISGQMPKSGGLLAGVNATVNPELGKAFTEFADPEMMHQLDVAAQEASAAVHRVAGSLNGGFGGGSLSSASDALAEAAARAAEEVAREAKELEEQFADMWQQIRIHQHEGAMALVKQEEELAQQRIAAMNMVTAMSISTLEKLGVFKNMGSEFDPGGFMYGSAATGNQRWVSWDPSRPTPPGWGDIPRQDIGDFSRSGGVGSGIPGTPGYIPPSPVPVVNVYIGDKAVQDVVVSSLTSAQQAGRI